MIDERCQDAETIVAISTPPGYSGIGVIRMSGPGSLAILAKVFHPVGHTSDFPNRTAVYGTVCDPEHGTVLDDGIALIMRGPASYTGEDVVEISLHGSPVVLDMVVRTLVKLGARPAARGEFTRRAFLAGKLDLVQAEAVIDLIEANNPAAAGEARVRLDATVSQEIRAVSDAIKDVVAELEAHIDFDEDDLEPAPQPVSALSQVLIRMEKLLQAAQVGRMRRQGIETVIAGKPNVGKSTLFNALIRTDRMIVTPYPGTTRDPVEDRLLLDGMSFVLSDTAGIREDSEPIEEEGIRRSRNRIDQADLVLWVLDGTSGPDKEDIAVGQACFNKPTIIVLNKVDLGLMADLADSRLGPQSVPRVALSAKTGEGLESLELLLCRMGREFGVTADRGALGRRGQLLVDAAQPPLKDIVDRLGAGEAITPEIMSLELRRVLSLLEEITGESVDDGVLDRIFERFCVGK
jgi:tRNA modification GTPase